MTGSGVGWGLSRLLPVALVAGLGLGACGSTEPGPPAVAEVPSAVPATPSAVSVAPSEAVRVAPVRSSISKAGLDYFFAIALGSEYGSKIKVVTMWDKPVVTVRVHGGSAKSRDCLNKVIADFNGLTATTDLKVAPGVADIELHFVPASQFRAIVPSATPGSNGYFQREWSYKYEMTSATVLVRSTGVSEKFRCHLIREEMTQAMGLGKDSVKYPDSVFYDKSGPNPTRYSALDKEIIRLLYGGTVRPGDGEGVIRQTVTVK
ncbi:DUF2927 domain-containing protein [Actinoplanes sp. NPDC048796]|uniref:DUF2927 domain-containing protein n=1 Tax=unclassified Actinoplanes TaxID=2626549 RepID=UPI0033D690C1